MQYLFFDIADDELIERSEMPTESGISVALLTTGYDASVDEVVQIAISDFEGNVLFSQTVKPQNIEDWDACDASGGISPQDVADAPELYQFEDEIFDFFDNAEVVVADRTSFVKALIEASWVSLPDFPGADLLELFRLSHCTPDYRNEPATAVTLADIADYYGIENSADDAEGHAILTARCYRALVAEFGQQREAKGAAYWEDYQRKLEEAKAGDLVLQEAQRRDAIRTNSINALLWLCAAAVFANLAVQLHLRGFDFGFVVIAAAAGVYFLARWIRSLMTVAKLRSKKKAE